MTCHTGPSGLSTFGRVAPLEFCAATGVAKCIASAAAAAKRTRDTPDFPDINFIGNLSFQTILPDPEAVRCCHRDCPCVFRTDPEGSKACSSTFAHYRGTQCGDFP